MGGGSSESTSTTHQAPWGPAQPYIKEALNEGQDMFHHYVPSTYQNMVAGYSPMQELGMYGTAQRALQGSPLESMASSTAWDQMQNSQSPALNFLTGAMYDPTSGSGMGIGPMLQVLQNSFAANPAMPFMGDTAAGGKLNSNPYLDDMMANAAGSITDQYRNATAPSTQGAFSGGGRLRGGSAAGGAYDTVMARNEGELMSGLSAAATDTYGNAYNMERGLQEQAAKGLGDVYNNWIAQQRASAEALGGLGNMQAQNQLNAAGQMGDQYFQGLTNQGAAAQAGMQFANRDYENLQQLMGVGDQMQGQNQRYIDDAARVHEWYQSGTGSPIAALARYWDPAFQAGSAFKSSQTTEQTETDPGMMGILGMGMKALTGLGGIPGFSDRRMKRFITTIGCATSSAGRVLPLYIYAWQWRDEGEEGLHVPEELRGKWDTGFIAQEVQEHYPDCVLTDRAGRLKIKYDMLAMALQEEAA